MTKKAFFLILSLAFFFLTNLVICQNASNAGLYPIADFDSDNYTITTTYYNSENGLPGRFASYVHKDSRGLLWMTTLHGLHRFDGRDFKTFNRDTHLPFNLVMEIYEDSEGYFWLYKSCYEKNSDNCHKTLSFFHPLSYDTLNFEARFGSDVPFSQPEIEHIIANKAGNTFCIRTTAATYRWQVNKGFDAIPSNGLDERPYVFTILEDGRMGAYFQNEETYIYYLLDASGKIIFQQTLSDNNKLAKHFSAFPFTFNSISKFVNFRNTIRFESQDSFFLYRVGIDGQLNKDTTFSKLDLDLELGARHIFLDESTNTFWNADRRGVQRMELRRKRFQNIKVDNETMMVMLTRTLKDGKVLISGSTGTTAKNSLFLYDRNHTKNLTTVAALENDAEIPSSEYFSSEGKFLTIPSGIILSKDDKYFNLNSANILFEDSEMNNFFFTKRLNEQLWIGALNGLWIYDYAKGKLKKFDAINEFAAFNDCSVRQIVAIDSDKYWIGTNDGIFLLSIKNGLLEHYSKTQNRAFYLPISMVCHIQIQEDGSLLLATKEGLVHFAGKQKGSFENGERYKHFNKEGGLPTNLCLAIYPDDYGFYWIATSSSLVQMEIATGRMKVYNKKNGLELDYFLREGHHEAPNGELFFGTLGGFVHFHPKDFKDENFGAPDIPIVIVDFEQYNQQTEKFEIRTNELLENNKITLNPNEKIFNLRVALADYRGADKHQFAYRIPGYQEEWQIDKTNLIRISGLSVGAHTLEIKGQLEDGRFSSQVLKIPISVLPPIYLRWWFISLVAIFLTSFGYLLNRRRTRSLKNRQTELEKLVKERTQIIESQTEELRSLDQMKSRFFANISHELRTPLTLMLAPIENTLKRNRLENRDFTNLLTAQKNGRQLNRMINEILDLTKLEAGKLELKPEKTVWYNFLKTIAANFESLANRKDIDFHFQYKGNQYLQVQIDQNKLEVILLNLLSNAFKFTYKGQKVELLAKDRGDFLLLEVRDTGRGIHPDDLPRVFDRFYQTKQKDSATEGGTGIGLALSREFVELMNGKIEVESELRKGTSFKVLIPKVEVISQLSNSEALLIENGALEIEKEPLKMEYPPISKSSATILLVEDNLDLQNFIKSLLEPIYNVITADNGKEAISILSLQSSVHIRDASSTSNSEVNKILSGQTEDCGLKTANLIISDIMMPLMDGYQLLEAIKSNPDLRHIPVIMLTARAEKEDKLKALRIGVDDYLTKPFMQEELLVRIENLLQNAAIRQTAFQEVEAAAPPTETEPLASHLPSEEEQAWLDELEKMILSNLENFNYTLDTLADDMHISKRQLYRRVKQLIGQTPNDYIKTLRLAKARAMLKEGKQHSVKAVAFSVGFKDVVYFSRQFKKEFGKLPSEY